MVKKSVTVVKCHSSLNLHVEHILSAAFPSSIESSGFFLFAITYRLVDIGWTWDANQLQTSIPTSGHRSDKFSRR